MDLFRNTVSLLITHQCYDEYFVKFNFTDAVCFKIALSKCLGYAIVLGSILVKVPQILKILKSKSVEGISLLSVLLELSAICLYAFYSYVMKFPFSSWGDSAFVGVQTFIIGFLVLMYSQKALQLLLFTIIYTFITTIVLMGYVPKEVLWNLQCFNMFIVFSAKVAQSYRNYVNGHTGQLSAITLSLMFGGSLARIFTSIQETGDSMMIITCMVAALGNTIIFSQLLYYWNVIPKEAKTKVH